MCNSEKQKQKQNNKLIDTDKRLLVTRGKGARGWVRGVKGVNCMMMDGN